MQLFPDYPLSVNLQALIDDLPCGEGHHLLLQAVEDESQDS